LLRRTLRRTSFLTRLTPPTSRRRLYLGILTSSPQPRLLCRTLKSSVQAPCRRQCSPHICDRSDSKARKACDALFFTFELERTSITRDVPFYYFGVKPLVDSVLFLYVCTLPRVVPAARFDIRSSAWIVTPNVVRRCVTLCHPP
jgi:hypothetical protein